MEFKKFSAGAVAYGRNDPKPDKNKLETLDISNVNFEDPNVEKYLNDPSHPNHYYLKRMLEILAVCHTIVVEEKRGKNVFSASSPDELALVQGAKYLGLTF